MLFKSKYPQEDKQLLENLTLSQYNDIFKALIENKDLQTIKEIMKKYLLRVKNREWWEFRVLSMVESIFLK